MHLFRRMRVFKAINRAGLFLAICSLVFLVSFAYIIFRPKAQYIKEDMMFMIDPTAQRADDYGEEHFNGRDPDQYDLPRAEYFFEKVVAIDPTTPYLYHELARIAFLKGDFKRALALISIQISLHGDTEPNSYYVRGLIEGFMGNYDASVQDYAHYIQFDPHDWAAKNDEAWVLLKAERYKEALAITDSGLIDAPDNAWLLNSKATALYELGRYKDALPVIQAASKSVSGLTAEKWSHAYPGNDPLIASQGLASFQNAVDANLKMIQKAASSSLSSTQ